MRPTALTLAMLVLTTVGSSSAAEPTGEEFTEVLGFRLLSVTLADVQKRLGAAGLREVGEAGGYEASVCYVVPSVSTALVFKSSELGGPRHDLLGLELRRYFREPPRGCAVVADREFDSSALHLAELRLGMSRKAFVDILGSVEETPDGPQRTFVRRQPMTPAELARHPGAAAYPYWDIVITVSGEFSEGVLVRLTAWKTMTW